MADRIRNSCIALGIFSIAMAGVSGGQAAEITVSRGDTLFKLAAKHLKDGNKWEDLCKANSKVLGSNCNLLIPGMKLQLPGKDSEPVKTATAPGTFMLTVANEKGNVFTAPSGYSVQRPNGADYVVLGGATDGKLPSSGGTPGIWIRLGDDLEKAASGKTVTVTVEVSAEKPGKVAFSYSTYDVGNSGWKINPLSGGLQKTSFSYNVPQMKKGNGDYLGILPDPEKNGQKINVYSVEAKVEE